MFISCIFYRFSTSIRIIRSISECIRILYAISKLVDSNNLTAELMLWKVKQVRPDCS